MASEIIIDVKESQTRVALLEDKDLVELYVERENTNRLVGNIYIGKVINVLPGMQAAFVDIGYEKNAFLYVCDAIARRDFEDFKTDEPIDINNIDVNIEDIVKPGQEIMVQVIKEAIDTKGPRITTHITLPGKHLVLVPECSYIGVSRRIEDEEEKERLRTIAEKLKPNNMGLILRTASEHAKEEELEEDIDFLKKLWSDIQSRIQNGVIPRKIHSDLVLVERVVRDIFGYNISRLVVNDKNSYSKILELVNIFEPALKVRIEYFNKDNNIFDYFDVECQIEKILNKKVWLKSGGYIIIEQTEALTVIDVNTGKFIGNTNLENTVLRTNIEATKEIVKQLRLRDIGGIIIIDYIDLHTQNNQNLLLDTLKSELKKDRTKTSVMGITSLGLVEMTRKKVRQKLTNIINIDCQHCGGTGKILNPEIVAENVYTRLRRVINQTLSNDITVEVHNEVFKLIKNDDYIKSLEEKYDRNITVKEDKSLKYNEIKIMYS